MLVACREALESLPQGSFREQAAGYLVRAAMELGDAEVVLQGKREGFLSAPNEKNLIDLLQEAENQNRRSHELNTILKLKEEFKDRQAFHGDLYLKVLLMAGRLDEAFSEGKDDKSTGWSYGKVGVLFASILSALTENSQEAVVIRALLREYAEKAYRFVGYAEGKEDISREIINGLASLQLTSSERQKYLTWAERLGRDRVESIVSNQHRGAYERAAMVLGGLAECYVLSRESDKAKSLLKEFIDIKFPRHRAFRAEVKRLVGESVLLRGLRVT
jgi:hypothetical protein